MMNDPIPIKKDGNENTVEEYVTWNTHRQEQKRAWMSTIIVWVFLGACLTPLVVWLTRLALGG